VAEIRSTEDLIRLLKEDASFREAAWRELLGEELLSMPRSLVVLTNELRELQETLARFIESTERRLSAIEGRLSALEADNVVIKQDIATLKEDNVVIKQDIATLKIDNAKLKDDMVLGTVAKWKRSTAGWHRAGSARWPVA
jgi:chromosome segregation ATPase